MSTKCRSIEDEKGFFKNYFGFTYCLEYKCIIFVLASLSILWNKFKVANSKEKMYLQLKRQQMIGTWWNDVVQFILCSSLLWYYGSVMRTAFHLLTFRSSEIKCRLCRHHLLSDMELWNKYIFCQ